MYKCIPSIYCENRYLHAKRETLAIHRNAHVIFLLVDKFQLVSIPLYGTLHVMLQPIQKSRLTLEAGWPTLKTNRKCSWKINYYAFK